MNGFSAATQGPQDVVIANNSVKNSGSGSLQCIFEEYADGMTITGNSVSNCGTDGIGIAGGNNEQVSSNTIFDVSQTTANTFWGIKLTANSGTVSTSNIANNVINDDQVSHTGTRGIIINAGTNNKVTGNLLTNQTSNTYLDTGSTTTLESGNSWSLTFATLPSAPANGSIQYCSDCTIANPCAGSGTGAFAKRINAVWVCN
jgi:parallel beta-helix repeat protein